MRDYAILLLLLFVGCTSSHQLATSPNDEGISFEEFQEAVQDEYALITLKDSVVSGKILEVRPDSLIYELWLYNPWRHPRQAVLFSQVVRIEYSSTSRAIKEWAGIGAVTGALIGTQITIGPRRPPALVRIITGFLGGCVGGSAGLIAGLIVGHKMEYQIQRDSQTQKE